MTTHQDQAPTITLCALRETALSVDEVLSALTDPGSGGIALFVGVVRDNDSGRDVTELGYSAHPTAERELRQVCADIATAHPEVREIAAVHRVGDLTIGEPAVVVGVAAPHRGEAMQACRALIDEIKARVPLWKHQRFTDGESGWVGVD
jgi:molybdopterin synthase catalytic subunit